VARRAVPQHGEQEEVAVVRESDGADRTLHALHQRVALGVGAEAVARLQHPRRVVLLQHRHEHAFQRGQHAVDERVPLLHRRLLLPQLLPRLQ